MELFFSALIIFCLRLADQSLGTMRNLLVNKSKPFPALIGLVESAIWVLAVSEVIKDIYDPFLIGAYAFGFAAGTIIGSYIENFLAVGNVVIRVFCPAESPSIANTLRSRLRCNCIKWRKEEMERLIYIGVLYQEEKRKKF